MTEPTTSLAPVVRESSGNQQLTAFASESAFEAAQRMAKALCSSTLVPTTFQGNQNLGSALIALEIAQRLGASPLMVMQNLNVIHGRPAWSSQFIIAALNSCGRFSPLRFDMTGEGEDRSCTAWALDSRTGDKLEGPPASIAMAKKEGWATKNGSKWQTMPELMLRYRAAAFFGRLYAPDVLMGMQTVEEIADVGKSNIGTVTSVASALDSPAKDGFTGEESRDTSIQAPPEPAPRRGRPAKKTDSPDPSKPAAPIIEATVEPVPEADQAPEGVANETTTEPAATDDSDIFG